MLPKAWMPPVTFPVLQHRQHLDPTNKQTLPFYIKDFRSRTHELNSEYTRNNHDYEHELSLVNIVVI